MTKFMKRCSNFNYNYNEWILMIYICLYSLILMNNKNLQNWKMTSSSQRSPIRLLDGRNSAKLEWSPQTPKKASNKSIKFSSTKNCNLRSFLYYNTIKIIYKVFQMQLPKTTNKNIKKTSCSPTHCQYETL